MRYLAYTMKLGTICGSLQAGSSNRALLDRLSQSAPADITVVSFGSLEQLPHFNPDLEGPAVVIDFRAFLTQCDAVVFACPEYGHSLPGVVKNAIDWVIGTGEFYEKIVGIIASVNHPERGRKGLVALETTLRAVDARIVFHEPIVRGPEEAVQLQRLFERIQAK